MATSYTICNAITTVKDCQIGASYTLNAHGDDFDSSNPAQLSQ